MSRSHLVLISIVFFFSCQLSSEKVNTSVAVIEESTTQIAEAVNEQATSTIEAQSANSAEIESSNLSEDANHSQMGQFEEKSETMLEEKTPELSKSTVEDMDKGEAPAVATSTPKAVEKYEESTQSVESNLEASVRQDEVSDDPVVSTTSKDAGVVKNSDETGQKAKDEPVKEKAKENRPAIAEGHALWNELLTKYVSSSGVVDYGSFKKNEAQLNSYLSWLSANAPSKSDKSQKAKAYWINAYNAYTIKLIVDNYPVSSITDLHGGKPWDVSWITLGGSTYSLNNIEHDILRPIWKDARIHFAVNCAAKSCPPIANKAYTVGNLSLIHI